MKGLETVLASMAIIAAFAASAEAAMPRKFTIACEAGRFSHGRSEAAARAALTTSAERGPQYRDVYDFDLEARQTKMSWNDGKRSQTRTMTAVTADTIEIYNYHLLQLSSVRIFDFRTMLNTSVTQFTSADPEYAWALTVQKCAMR